VPQWQPAPHLLLADEKIVAAIEGRGPRNLVYQMPPRHGKSEYISKNVSAWAIGTYPERGYVMFGSYGAHLAAKYGRGARDLIDRWGPELFGIKVDPFHRQIRDWNVIDAETGVGMNAGWKGAGVGGPFTGEGAWLAIVDDPVKNWADGQSKLKKDNAWEWYATTFSSRLTPDGITIMIMARWAEDDLAGRAMEEWEQKGVEYELINLPALAEDDDPLGRPKGTALWAAGGWTVEALEERRKRVGDIYFDAAFMGKPTNSRSSMFQRGRFREFEIVDGYFVHHGSRTQIAMCRVFGMVDLASSLKKTADYTVIGTFARSPFNDIFVLDIIRERIPTTEQLPRLWEASKTFRHAYVGIEAVAYQSSFVQAAIQSGLPAVPVHADADKITRAIPLATAYMNGKVFHLRNAPWRREFEAELLAFPFGAHDDQVDAAAYAQISIVEQGAAPAGVYVPR
jgi:predicted phage terminase large subunit-like protein